MDASAFWEVIGNYNLNTGIYQIVLLSLLVAGILASYLSKYKWIAKAVLGIRWQIPAIGHTLWFTIWETGSLSGHV